MKTILRNFFSVMRRFKMAGLLNVLGLSVAFTAFMVIMMQQVYDTNFDRCYPGSECVYRLDFSQPGGYRQSIISRPLARLLVNSSSHIVASALYDGGGKSSDLFFSIERNGNKLNFREARGQVTPGYPQVFQFDMLAGDSLTLQDPGKVLLPLSLARKLFGEESAVGRQLLLEEPGQFYTVGGVYRDFPRNASVENVMYTAIGPKDNYDEWGNWNYSCFVRLDSPHNVADVQAGFKKAFDAKEVFGSDGEKAQIQLDNLAELHFDNHVEWDTLPKASRSTLLVLFAIGFIIVLIAAINFTNFSTALAPMRIKSINTQKVLGSSPGIIRAGLMAEAVGISVIAYLLSLLWIVMLRYTPVATFTDADMSLAAQLPIVWGTAALAVVIGLLAGIYPARYMTSFQPALVLKGSFGLSPKGRQMRNVLIGIQFIASFALIVGAMFMYLQNQYMRNAPMGYEKDAVIVTDMNNRLNQSRETFSDKLKSLAGIEEVTYAEFLLSSQDKYMGWGRSYRNKSINFQCLPVDPSFLRVMGIQPTQGRDFRPEDGLADSPRYIFNERARTEFEMELNEKIDGAEIVGFVPDIKFASFRTSIEPMAFLVWGKTRWSGSPLRYRYAYVKVKAGTDLREAFRHVQQSLKTIDPEYPYSVRFFDEVLNRTYEKEQKIGSMVTLFSLMAVFISMVGVFGLVVFDSEYRRREISVRKVLGSTTNQILILFNRTYIRIILVCFVIAAPLAWYTVHRWLENFAYRTPMYAWVYVVALLVVAVITIITVTFQNWRAANDNPVNSIKSE